MPATGSLIGERVLNTLLLTGSALVFSWVFAIPLGVLAAVYRAAGLPARTVIGLDVGDSKSDGKKFLGKKGRGRFLKRGSPLLQT